MASIFTFNNKGHRHMTTLPRDTDNTPIPALRLNPNGAHTINATTTSACNTAAFDEETRVVSVYATTPVYIKFGDDTVEATSSDHYFPAGLYFDFAIGGDKTLHTQYLAVITPSGTGAVYISEKQ
jgi:hypothetical protein